jgi:hypothetical protein
MARGWYWVNIPADHREDNWPHNGLPKRWWKVHQRFLTVLVRDAKI